ncbi:MAG: SpoIIE family protein phosphatase [Bacteroidetes bacterium]|nr:SpoIIE family protein phosphatase [Bacteroidota bacterium]
MAIKFTNPFIKFKHWIIGEALVKAEDVFEKAKLNMMFNFTLFFLVLGLVFYANIFANNYWWQFYITTFGVITLPLVFVVLKKTQSAKSAAYVFMTNQIVMGLLNEWLFNFELNAVGGFWQMVQVIVVFFVLGKRWGLFISIFTIMEFLVVPLDKVLNHRLLDYYIPPEQIPEQFPLFVIVPFLICVYGLYEVVNTRAAAEQQIKSQRALLEMNNEQLEAQKHDILSSINYAQKIQYAILPHEETISASIPSCFIFYQPKDIVSGDFFWFHEIDKSNYILVCADCTGHGVPGAFMTVIGSTLLNQTVIDNKTYSPSKILLEVDRLLNSTLKQNIDRRFGVQDGMDLSMLKVNKDAREIIITSAKRPVVFIRNNQVQDLKGSKYSLGGMRTGDKIFEEIKFVYEPGDILYFFTDGYPDQFGGEKARMNEGTFGHGKKFSTKRLKEFFLEIHSLPMEDQKKLLSTRLSGWKGDLEQVDDICVIGIRF